MRTFTVDPCMLPCVRIQVDKMLSPGTSFAVWLILFGLSGSTLGGCSSGSDDQKCIPLSQSGCPRGQICTVDVDGAPTCIQVAAETVAEGSSCQAPRSTAETGGAFPCPAGYGCIQYHGVDRCLRFCDAERAENDNTCQPTNTDAEGVRHPLAEWARCDLVLDGRPDIAACSLPCNPEDTEALDCPDNTRCALSVGDQVARCQLFGLGQTGQSCGSSCRCDRGLQCVAESGSFVCRPFARGGACGMTVVLRPSLVPVTHWR